MTSRTDLAVVLLSFVRRCCKGKRTGSFHPLRHTCSWKRSPRRRQRGMSLGSFTLGRVITGTSRPRSRMRLSASTLGTTRIYCRRGIYSSCACNRVVYMMFNQATGVGCVYDPEVTIKTACLHLRRLVSRDHCLEPTARNRIGLKVLLTNRTCDVPTLQVVDISHVGVFLGSHQAS